MAYVLTQSGTFGITLIDRLDWIQQLTGA